MKTWKSVSVSCVIVATLFITIECSWLEHLDLAHGLKTAGDNLPALAKKEGEEKLVEALTRTHLTDTLSGTGPFTLFGPNDESFGRLPDAIIHYLKQNVTAMAEVLKYHVIAGKSVYSSQLSNNLLVDSYFGPKIRINIYNNGAIITASGRRVIKANVNASNGVLHEIEGMMLPPVGDIVQTLSVKGLMRKIFLTFLKAVAATDLKKTLKGKGPLTVFAPTSKAFKKLDPAFLDKLLKNKTELQSVLEYHVVAAAAYSVGLSEGTVKTLNGQTLKIDIDPVFEEITVNNARIEYPDITTTNGVIHVIDTVLIPPMSMSQSIYDAVDNRLKYKPLFEILRFN